MPSKSLWNIRLIREGYVPKWGLFYGQDLVGEFEYEEMARRVMVLLITAGDKMILSKYGGLEFKPYKPGA